jgi:hypothetical protein
MDYSLETIGGKVHIHPKVDPCALNQIDIRENAMLPGRLRVTKWQDSGTRYEMSDLPAITMEVAIEMCLASRVMR